MASRGTGRGAETTDRRKVTYQGSEAISDLKQPQSGSTELE